MIIIYEYQSPCGTLVLGSVYDCLCMCDWLTEPHHGRIKNRLSRILKMDFKDGSSAVIENARKELDEFFEGKRKCFDIPLMFAGTDFQQSVWHALQNIGYGETVSYAELAKTLGNEKAVRAVANANGANALSIFVPCHRVIGSNNSLTGYAGGIKAKGMLLAIEQNH